MYIKYIILRTSFLFMRCLIYYIIVFIIWQFLSISHLVVSESLKRK